MEKRKMRMLQQGGAGAGGTWWEHAELTPPGLGAVTQAWCPSAFGEFSSHQDSQTACVGTQGWERRAVQGGESLWSLLKPTGCRAGSQGPGTQPLIMYILPMAAFALQRQGVASWPGNRTYLLSGPYRRHCQPDLMGPRAPPGCSWPLWCWFLLSFLVSVLPCHRTQPPFFFLHSLPR